MIISMNSITQAGMHASLQMFSQLLDAGIYPTSSLLVLTACCGPETSKRFASQNQQDRRA